MTGALRNTTTVLLWLNQGLMTNYATHTNAYAKFIGSFIDIEYTHKVLGLTLWIFYLTYTKGFRRIEFFITCPKR